MNFSIICGRFVLVRIVFPVISSNMYSGVAEGGIQHTHIKYNNEIRNYIYAAQCLYYTLVHYNVRGKKKE